MKKVKEKIFALGQYARENERKTNKLVMYLSFVFVALSLFSRLSVLMDYSYGLEITTQYVITPICFIIIIIDFIAVIFKFDKPWLKYLLVGAVLLYCSASYAIYTNYVTFLIILPVFISIHYFDKKFLLLVSVETVLLFFLAVFLNFQLRDTETFQMLHRMASFNSWTYVLDVFLYIVVPIAAVIVFMVIYSINLTSSGVEMLKAESEFSAKIASSKAELETASVIQQSAIPAGDYVSCDGNFEIAATEIPAKEVSGDFYDYFQISENAMVFMVADVSDKGVPAAMFMMSARKAIRCAIECCRNLEEAIPLANRLICQDNESGMFLTLWLGVINTKTGVGKYVNAGHCCPIIRHADGSISRVENDPDLFLGSFPEENPRLNMLTLRAGDSLLIYTDGVTDATNADGAFYGRERFEESVKASYGSAAECRDSAVRQVQSFIGDAEQFDDITLMVVHCNNVEEAEKKKIQVNAGPEGTEKIIDEVEAMLAKYPNAVYEAQNLSVIIDEVCSNIHEHGYDGQAGKIDVDVACGANFVEMEFRSGGRAFDPTQAEDPDFADEPQFGGLGVYLVKNLADEVTYKFENGQNVLKVIFIFKMQK